MSGAIPATGSSFDLQAVGCHEYGHALGLGHTPVPGSTMEAAVASGQVHPRSIEADDIGGVQALYGVKAANKPTITAVSGSGPVIITGTDFPLSNVEVWFTYANPSAAGAVLPLKVSGLTSNGTQVSVSPPASSGVYPMTAAWMF